MRMPVFQRLYWPTVFAVITALVFSGTATAQQRSTSGPPNALQGFSQNRNEPIKIDADSLEVRDKDKVATFSGNVRLVQGDTVLRSSSLVVFYTTDARTAAANKEKGKGSTEENIRRIEARGDVVVTQKDQKATAENGFLDMKTNVITLVGNVIISQGHNMVRGDRLSVDLATGVSRVECNKSSECRVQALLRPRGEDRAPVRGDRERAASGPRSLSPPGL